MAAHGEKSSIHCTGVNVHNCAKVGLFVGEGGRLHASECDVSDSEQYDGISIRGVGSSATILSCKVLLPSVL